MIVVGKRNWKNILVIKEILQLFELVSELKVNIHKISHIGVNIHGSWLEEASKVLHCKVKSTSFTYLGLSIGSIRRRVSE